jgi:cyclopropane fatty-acyl-phospholipid synthase-like methyltransferase
MKLINKCPITDSETSMVYLNLGDIPLVNNLNNSKQESLECKKYPLSVQLFTDSGLSSLTIEIDPNILYSNYLYKSGVSEPYIKHCMDMFEFVDHYLELTEHDNILDIGGNDGTLLKTFLKQKSYLNVLNIDASTNLTNEAIQNNIPSINKFWNSKLAKEINKKFKLITTTNCFQHTFPIKDFVYGISLALENRGIWCLEFPYWKTSMETNQFDQIYHEHIFYYTLNPIQKLLSQFNLRIIKITHHDIHGGTVRLLISQSGDLGQAWQPCNWSVEQNLEKDDRFSSISTYIDWGNNIHKIINDSKKFILSLKNQNFKIAGFGAAAKGCVFLNSLNLNYTHIDYVIDDTNLKQDKFIPGTGIQIKPRNILRTNPPDYILILAHNFSDYIIKSLRLDGYLGKFIIMFPQIQEI